MNHDGTGVGHNRRKEVVIVKKRQHPPPMPYVMEHVITIVKVHTGVDYTNYFQD